MARSPTPPRCAWNVTPSPVSLSSNAHPTKQESPAPAITCGCGRKDMCLPWDPDCQGSAQSKQASWEQHHKTVDMWVPVEARQAHCGTPAKYRRGCKCDYCKRAHAADAKVHRDRRARQLQEDPSIAPHGHHSTYSNYRCRCDLCVGARKKYRSSMIEE